MNDKKTNINLNLIDLNLRKLSVQKNTNNEESIRENDIHVIGFTEEEKILELKYTDKFIHNSIIELEMTISLEVDGDISLDDINKIIASDNVDDIAYPLLAEASHIISFITSKTELIPVIVPPTIMRNKE